MIQFDTRGRAWHHSEYSEAAIGDAGPWVWWLPLAWRAVTDPLGEHALPPPPRLVRPDDNDSHAYRLAWWGPLLHLLFFGNGWVRPDLGLARWLALGQPDSDPVLKIVKRWWESRVTEVLAWSSCLDTLTQMAERVSDATHTSIRHVPLPDRWADSRKSPAWTNAWAGGTDSMHLGTHALTPVWDEADGAELIVSASKVDGAARAVLTLPSYLGWYAALSRLGSGLPPRADGPSWRVDVVVRPLGCLGTYRCSRRTGRWFSGRHQWHELGIDEPLAD
jgi:hypothetical protein